MYNKTPEQISFNMRQVHSKDSAIEQMLRKELRLRGIHYRKNSISVLGKPDIVFKGLKVAVFCDSEFWHGYNWEERKKDFKSHQEFWIPKIERNMERDKQVTEELQAQGWKVVRLWGNDIKHNVVQCADIIAEVLKIRRDINEI